MRRVLLAVPCSAGSFRRALRSRPKTDKDVEGHIRPDGQGALCHSLGVGWQGRFRLCGDSLGVGWQSRFRLCGDSLGALGRLHVGEHDLAVRMRDQDVGQPGGIAGVESLDGLTSPIKRLAQRQPVHNNLIVESHGEFRGQGVVDFPRRSDECRGACVDEALGPAGDASGVIHENEGRLRLMLLRIGPTISLGRNTDPVSISPESSGLFRSKSL